MMLTDQNIVMVRGTSGIGLATAHAAAEAVARVTTAGPDPEKLALAFAELGDEAHGETFDACDRDAFDAFFVRLGHLDHLNLAASGGMRAHSLTSLVRDELPHRFDAKF